MPASAADMEHWAVLKRRLVKFGENRRFARDLRRAFKDWYGTTNPVIDAGERVDAIDEFLLERPLSDGRTVVAQFVEEQTDLSDADRSLLLGWRDVVEGVFRVKQRDGDAIVTENLVDELGYRLYANAGPAALDNMFAGSYLLARVVPVPDGWMLSGVPRLYPAGQSDDALGEALELAETRPDLAARNPEKLEQAQEFQRADRQAFIDCFGADLLIVPVATAAARLREFLLYRTAHILGVDEKMQQEQLLGDDEITPLLEQLLPQAGPDARTMALLHDESDGLHFFEDYDRVIETFQDPELAAERAHASLVKAYLEEPGNCGTALVRLARQDTDKASLVFRTILGQPGFDWRRDGEALIAKYKGSARDQAHFPPNMPLSDELTEYRDRDPFEGTPLTRELFDLKSAEALDVLMNEFGAGPIGEANTPLWTPAMPLPYAPVDLQPLLPAGANLPRVGRTPGRNEPCPCGSGKKYKRCCGA